MNAPATGQAARPPETTEQRYLRQIRNATQLMAFLSVVAAILAIIGGVLVVRAVDRIGSGGTGPVVNYNCASLGGTDPSC